MFFVYLQMYEQFYFRGDEGFVDGDCTVAWVLVIAITGPDYHWALNIVDAGERVSIEPAYTTGSGRYPNAVVPRSLLKIGPLFRLSLTAMSRVKCAPATCLSLFHEKVAIAPDTTAGAVGKLVHLDRRYRAVVCFQSDMSKISNGNFRTWVTRVPSSRFCSFEPQDARFSRETASKSGETQIHTREKLHTCIIIFEIYNFIIYTYIIYPCIDLFCILLYLAWCIYDFFIAHFFTAWPLRLIQGRHVTQHSRRQQNRRWDV